MSFSEFKNNTQILKKYMAKMNTITQSDIKPQWIEETFLKQNNPHVFMQILHYILIKFSPSVLFVKVLDFYPTIKDDTDKKFVTNTLTLARKMLDLDVKIDIDQFLSSKFVEKKTQFTSCFCKSAYEFYLKQTKQSSFTKSINNVNRKQNKLSSQVPVKLSNKQIVNEDQDNEAPRNLYLVPSSTKRPIVNKNDMQSSSEDEDLRELLNRKKELNKMKDKNFSALQPLQKPNSIHQSKRENPLPKTIGKFYQEQNDGSTIEQNRIQIQKTVGKYQKPQSSKSQGLQQNVNRMNYTQQQIEESGNKDVELDGSEYVSREEFMEIVSGMSKNFTELLTKFNEFQSQVSGWVQNVNAKISILEQNVKTIKNNL